MKNKQTNIFKIINKNKTLFNCEFDNDPRSTHFNLHPDRLLMLKRKIEWPTYSQK